MSLRYLLLVILHYAVSSTPWSESKASNPLKNITTKITALPFSLLFDGNIDPVLSHIGIKQRQELFT